MIASTRRGTWLAGIALIIALSGLAMTIGAQSAQSASMKSCPLSESEQFPKGPKPTYNLTLKVRSTSCATAKKVVAGFHKCRSRSGYRCTKKLLDRWRCTGTKDDSTSELFYGTVTCKTSGHLVRGTYQQNTPS